MLRSFLQNNDLGGEVPPPNITEMDIFLHFWYFKWATVHTCQFPERLAIRNSSHPVRETASRRQHSTETPNQTKIGERKVGFTILSVISALFATTLTISDLDALYFFLPTISLGLL